MTDSSLVTPQIEPCLSRKQLNRELGATLLILDRRLGKHQYTLGLGMTSSPKGNCYGLVFYYPDHRGNARRQVWILWQENFQFAVRDANVACRICCASRETKRGENCQPARGGSVALDVGWVPHDTMM